MGGVNCKRRWNNSRQGRSGSRSRSRDGRNGSRSGDGRSKQQFDDVKGNIRRQGDSNGSGHSNNPPDIVLAQNAINFNSGPFGGRSNLVIVKAEC